eukprot:3398035-Amphidinium_carterae.1
MPQLSPKLALGVEGILWCSDMLRCTRPLLSCHPLHAVASDKIKSLLRAMHAPINDQSCEMVSTK